jgi:hypothetical protein
VVSILTAATLAIGALALLAMKAHAAAIGFTAVFLSMWAAYFAATHRRDLSVAFLRHLATRTGLRRA